MNCPFCNIPEHEIIAESEYFFAKMDGYPVSKGHTLLISKRHVASYFDLTEAEQIDMVKLLNLVKRKADNQFLTRHYNVGINCGEFSGQTIEHVHIHLIPRKHGDVDDPRGGVRWVIPSKAKYWDE